MNPCSAILRQEAAQLRRAADRLDAEADALEHGIEPRDDLIRYHDAAPILRTSTDGVRKRVERGQLHKHTIAGRPFVSASAVRALATKAASMSAMSGSVSALSGCADAADER